MLCLSGFELYSRYVPLKTEPVVMRDLKMRGRRRQGKRRLKSEFAVFDLHRLVRVKKKERKFRRCMFMSFIKH